MPKIFEYACSACDDWSDDKTVREEFFGNLETPPESMDLVCEKCGKTTSHKKVPFSRGKPGGMTGDGSPYKGHCLG